MESRGFNLKKKDENETIKNIQGKKRYDRERQLSTCPLHINSYRCGKERGILIGPWRPAKTELVRNYLEVYWPCAGGLSAVNAIGYAIA